MCESKLYRTEEEVELLQSQIDEASSTSERVKLSKQLKKINEQLLELNKYEEVVHHWGDKMEPMDLDDGVKANYAKFQKLLAKIKKLASGAKAFRYTSYWCSHRSFIHHRLVLKKYIKSEPVRKEKAESAKSLGEVIKRYRTQRKMTKNLWQSL